MASGKTRGLLILLSTLQWYSGFYIVTLPYSLCVAAEPVKTPTIARREDDLADFGQTVPILGRVSNDLPEGLIIPVCFEATPPCLSR